MSILNIRLFLHYLFVNIRTRRTLSIIIRMRNNKLRHNFIYSRIIIDYGDPGSSKANIPRSITFTRCPWGFGTHKRKTNGVLTPHRSIFCLWVSITFFLMLIFHINYPFIILIWNYQKCIWKDSFWTVKQKA